MYQQDKTAFKHISRATLEMATDNNLKHMYVEEMDSESSPYEVVFCMMEDKLMAVSMTELILLGWYESSFEEKSMADEACSANYYLHMPTDKVIALEHSVLDEYCIAKLINKGVFEIVAQMKKYRLKGLNTQLLRKLKIAELTSD